MHRHSTHICNSVAGIEMEFDVGLPSDNLTQWSGV